MAMVLGWPLVVELLLSGVPAVRPLLLGSAVPTAICGPSGVPDGSWGSVSAAMAWLGLLAVGAFGVAATVSRTSSALSRADESGVSACAAGRSTSSLRMSSEQLPSSSSVPSDAGSPSTTFECCRETGGVSAETP